VVGFEIWGVVKETGVDDAGLADFSANYLGAQYPLYCDKTRAFYQALGDRKVGLSTLLNPSSFYGFVCDAYTRLTSSSKSMSTNAATAATTAGLSTSKGEGLVQGGIIVFDQLGNPVAMYEEETGVDLRVADIAAALNAVRQQQQQLAKELNSQA